MASGVPDSENPGSENPGSGTPGHAHLWHDTLVPEFDTNLVER